MNCLSRCCESHEEKVDKCKICCGGSGLSVYATAVVAASVFAVYEIHKAIYYPCIKEKEREYNGTESYDYIAHLCGIDATLGDTFGGIGALIADIVLIAVAAGVLHCCANSCLRSRKFRQFFGIDSSERDPLLPMSVKKGGY